MSNTRFHFQLANRILKDKGNRFSRPIVALSVCGVSLGLVIMMVAIGITSGYKREIRDKVIAMGSHIRIAHYDENYTYEQVPFNKSQPFVEQLRQNPDIASVQNFATKVGIVKTTDQVEGIVLKGMDATFNQSLFRKNIMEGDTLCLGDTAADNHIIISKHLSDKLLLHIGDKVQTYFVQDPPRARKFTVAAIYQTGLPEYDERFALVDLRHIQKLNDWPDSLVSGIEVLIRDYDRIAEMGEYVHHRLPLELKAETIYQIYPEIFEWIALFDTNVAVLLLITTCVCIVTMMCIFFIVILEQTQTIGILKSLGMKTRHVVHTFMIVAGRILLRGMLVGDAIALLFGLLQQRFHFVKLNPETYYTDFVPVHYDPWAVIGLNLSVFLICMAVLVVPAWVVGRKITPVNAVRFE
ncbi:MAG: ABC transporter permease [Bacteroidales bacterium]|nr:ABC transporter permease [Bacteroidales bacterium]